MVGIAKCVGFSRPREAVAGALESEPLETLMLVAELDVCISSDEGREGKAQLNGVRSVQVEAADSDVVQRLGFEPGFFFELADRSFLRLLTSVDFSVDRFPG